MNANIIKTQLILKMKFYPKDRRMPRRQPDTKIQYRQIVHTNIDRKRVTIQLVDEKIDRKMKRKIDRQIDEKIDRSIKRQIDR